MGMELVIERAAPFAIAALLAKLAESGIEATVIMVDGQLVPPGAAVTESWREVRLSTPQGPVSLRRRPDGFAVVVMGNASPALVTAQRVIAEAVREI